jgi:Tfp pilus assembly protein PilV
LTQTSRSNIPFAAPLPSSTKRTLAAARRGFTLFEVMLASGVMATGLVGMIQVVVSGSEMLDVARKQTLAANIIHTQIDLYRASIPADWSQVTNATTTISLSTAPMTTFSGVTTGFTCTRVVSNVSSDGTLKKVAYTVTWTGVTGRTHTRTGATYISKFGLHVSQQKT